MPYPQFDRSKVKMLPLADRQNKRHIERDHVKPDAAPAPVSGDTAKTIAETALRIRQARDAGKPVMLAFGAHTIKNGLSPVLIDLMEKGWVTHLATNGAGIIHDWEFAFQGKSSEDVARYVAYGQFGNWEETGRYINLALNVGAFHDLGYGEAIGAMIENEGLTIPTASGLENIVIAQLSVSAARSAVAADLLDVIRAFNLKPGRMEIPHPWKRYSVQAAAFRLKIPLTGHPMFGHDIIYNHPMNRGANIGRCAERDFLTFAESVSRLSNGVYLSIGSAVMSPMVFEKSLSISRNVAQQRGETIDGHYLLVADLAKSSWDWSKGEPPESSPDYYLRFNKSFSRMGGDLRYVSIDNRDLLLQLSQILR